MARLLLLTYEFAPFRGGIATVVEGLAAGASALGHEVHVLAPDYFADQKPADRGRPYAVHRFAGDFCSILSIDKLTRFGFECRHAIARVRPDFVHATDPQSQMAATALARFTGLRSYGFTVHGTELLRYRRERVPRAWMHGAFRRPAAIAAVSHAVRALLLREFDVDPDRLFVAHPGIADEWFDRPPAARASVRTAWGAGDDDFVLITVARRVREKGHLRVIEAASRLPEAVRRRVVYVIVGDGPNDYASTIREAARLGEVRMHLAGALDADGAVAAVDGADAFIMLSERTDRRLEGFGLAYIEAAARGVPAIAADTGGSAEAVRDGETGLVVAESAAPSITAASIERLIGDAGLRARLGSAARERARAFTFERTAALVYDRFLAVRAVRSAASS